MTEVIVVGAGWFGLIAAKTYLKVHPDASLLILESAPQLGGTWSRDRVYRGMITHNAIGGLEISDFPLAHGTPTPEGYIRGADVSEYLHALATTYSLHSRIRCSSPVRSITRDPATAEWILHADGAAAVETYRCRKLIMATGLTSKPYTPPDIPVDDPRMALLHCTDLARSQARLEGPGVETVTVYGGSKSAFDAAYLCAAAGKRVHWIVRTTGHGVAAMFTATTLGQTSALLAPKRLLNALSPCIYNRHTRLSRLLHGTAAGRALVRTYWRTLTRVLRAKQGLDTSANGRALTPSLGELGPFWSGSTPTGVISQPDFWRHVHPPDARITVHRAEIAAVAGPVVRLSDGTELRPDAHVWATGWVRNSSPLDPALAMDSGVPVPLAAVPPRVAAHWDALEAAADRVVLAAFPLLAAPPPYVCVPRTHTPYRLYRLIAPPAMAARGDHALAHVGTAHTSATGMMAELQALWAVAYLDGSLQVRLDGREAEMEAECARANVWARRRYLNLGEKCANLTFEFLPYFDTLLEDMGINPRRKGAWWREWFATYTPRDYRGVVDEYMAKHGLAADVKDKGV